MILLEIIPRPPCLWQKRLNGSDESVLFSFPPSLFSFLLPFLFPSFLQFTYHHRCNECLLFKSIWGFPWWLRQKIIHLQCRRPGLDLWAGKIPWRRARWSTPVFLPGEPHEQRSPAGCCSPCSHKERHTTEQLTRWMQTLVFQERFKFWRLSGNAANYVTPINTLNS